MQQSLTEETLLQTIKLTSSDASTADTMYMYYVMRWWQFNTNRSGHSITVLNTPTNQNEICNH